MTRTYTPQMTVRLPQLGAADTVALMTSVETEAAVAGPLPGSIDRALKLTVTKREAVAATLVARGWVRPREPKRTRLADVTLDAAWSATRDWLDAWCRVPAPVNPHAAAAQAAYERLFGEKLAFTQIAFEAEWAESDLRLRAIKEGALEGTFEQLGGAAFLKNLRDAHAAYGAALGVTTPQPPPQPAPELRPLILEAHDALRAYVTKVMAHVEPDDPATKVLADKLLRPVTTWGQPQPG